MIPHYGMNNQRPITILLADNNPVFRLGVRSVLGDDPSFSVVGETSTGDRTIDLVRSLRPDVLLLDVQIDGIHALEVLRRLHRSEFTTKTVLLSGELDRLTTRTALLRGARGVLNTDLALRLLARCIRTVNRGELWIARDTASDLVDTIRRSARMDVGTLTAREIDIVNGVIQGASNKLIAKKLGVAEQTVKNRLRRIFAMLQVSNRVELALYAVEQGLTVKD